MKANESHAGKTAQGADDSPATMATARIVHARLHDGGREGVPVGTDSHKTLEAYFPWCSIEVTGESMAVVSGSLANGGICPVTSERIFQARL